MFSLFFGQFSPWGLQFVLIDPILAGHLGSLLCLIGWRNEKKEKEGSKSGGRVDSLVVWLGKRRGRMES